MTDTQASIIKLARFAILATLGFALTLLFLDAASGVGQAPRFMTANVAINVFSVLAFEFASAALAILVIAIRKSG